MIPSLVDIGPSLPWLVLPPGIHWATMDEIEISFATNGHRRKLFDGFGRAVSSLYAANCTTIFLDGSFVTGKECPSDFDGCWDPVGVVSSKLDPVLLDFENLRAAQKQKYFGEMFIAATHAVPGTTYLDFFQVEKISGKRKGIIGLKK